MTPVRFSRNFVLEEWPCWKNATAADVIVMRWVAVNVLQPARNRFGAIRITSWKYWARSDCREPRTGDHADAGTLDFVPLEAPIMDVFRWIGANLRGRYGSLIYERDHIHYTRPGIGVRQGETEFLIEPTEGVYKAIALPLSTAGIVAVVAALYFLTKR